MLQAKANFEYGHGFVSVLSSVVSLAPFDQRLDQVQKLVANVAIALRKASKDSSRLIEDKMIEQPLEATEYAALKLCSVK